MLQLPVIGIAVVCLTVSGFISLIPVVQSLTVSISPRVAVRSASGHESVTFNCSYSFTESRDSIRTLLVQWWVPDRPRNQSLLWTATNNPGSAYGKNSEQVNAIANS